MATGVEAVASASLARSKKAASDAGKHISRIDVAIEGFSLSPLPGDGQGEPQHRTVPGDLCQPRILWHGDRPGTVERPGAGRGAGRSGQIGVQGLVSPLPGWRDGVDKLIRSISSVDRMAPAVGWNQMTAHLALVVLRCVFGRQRPSPWPAMPRTVGSPAAGAAMPDCDP